MGGVVVEGTPFGRYRLIELLGRGGMGEVWRAFDTTTNRVVAVKVLPAIWPTMRSSSSGSAGSVRRCRSGQPACGADPQFRRNRRPAVCGHAAHRGPRPAKILADGPLEPARAVAIIEQVASALYAAHRIGLVHRDVKPSNILVDEDDFAYLIDFGIARAAGETRLTGTGIVIGTWAYLAPERLTRGRPTPAPTSTP